jgi:hypothetical protein
MSWLSDASSVSARWARARSWAEADSLLATTATARNTASTTQFCGSAMAKVPTGCRKKKLKVSIDASDAMTATRSRAKVAVPSTISSSTSATVVVLMWGMRCSRSAATAIAASPPSRTTASRRNGEATSHCVTGSREADEPEKKAVKSS